MILETYSFTLAPWSTYSLYLLFEPAISTLCRLAIFPCIISASRVLTVPFDFIGYLCLRYHTLREWDGTLLGIWRAFCLPGGRTMCCHCHCFIQSRRTKGTRLGLHVVLNFCEFTKASFGKGKHIWRPSLLQRLIFDAAWCQRIDG